MQKNKTELTDEKIIAVIPAYNEAKRIASVVSATSLHVHEIIVVNDASKDDTAEEARHAGAFVVDLPQNRGAGYATRVGCHAALKRGASIIVTIDADGQHDPNEIPRLVSVLQERNLDIVFGGRPRTKNMPFENRYGNHLLSVLSKFLFDVNIQDTLTGFHAFRADKFPQLCWQSDRYSFVAEIVFRVALNHLSYFETPVSTIYHDHKKGMRKRDGMKILMLLLKWKLQYMFAPK